MDHDNAENADEWLAMCAGERADEEREQALNQLLSEMDGFTPDEGIVFIAATNRADLLDPALMRAGRFDRKVRIARPDARARHAILKVGNPNGSRLFVCVWHCLCTRERRKGEGEDKREGGEEPANCHGILWIASQLTAQHHDAGVPCHLAEKPTTHSTTTSEIRCGPY